MIPHRSPFRRHPAASSPPPLLAVVAFLALLLVPTLLRAGGDWDPVTEEDWAATDPEAERLGALILRETVHIDDSDLVNGKIRVEVARRIKILHEEGYDWAEVNVPWIHREGKVRSIEGRTLTPDGEEFELKKDHIVEKVVLDAKGLKVKQKSFSMPGVADGCIIEYRIVAQQEVLFTTWEVQKTVPIRLGEYRWTFFRGQGMDARSYGLVASEWSPRYLVANSHHREVKVEQKPSLTDAREIWFTARDVAPYEKEPYAPSISAAGIYIVTYYSDTDYWRKKSEEKREYLKSFTRSTKRVESVVAEHLAGLEEEEAISAAYRWVQDHLAPPTEEEIERGKLDENHDADDVIKRGRGTSEDRNLTFCALLRAIGVDATLCYLVDRNTSWFSPQAHFWQFDRSAIAVPDGAGGYTVSSPGERHLADGRLPWYNEVSAVYFIGPDVGHEFMTSEHSAADQNTISRLHELALDAEMNLSGSTQVTARGHAGRRLRILVEDDEGGDQLAAEVRSEYASAEIGPVTHLVSDSLASTGYEVTLEYPAVAQRAGSRTLIKPLQCMSRLENPFTSEAREHPIAFDYARQERDTIVLTLPEGWRLDALPEDRSFQNRTGRCGVSFTDRGRSLVIQRLFEIVRPVYPAAEYERVQELFATAAAMEEIVVVLRREEGTGPGRTEPGSGETDG